MSEGTSARALYLERRYQGQPRKIRLETRRQRVVFIAALVVLGGAFAMESARICLSQTWAASANPQLWKWAARLDPENATAWYRLGIYVSDQQLPSAQSVPDLQRAAAANPNSDLIWIALAEARETAGNFDGAREAFETARRVHPISPQVAWRYGNFLLRRNDFSAALEQFRRALQQDAGLSWNVLAECRSAGVSADEALDEALPHDADLYFAAMGYYLSQQDSPSAIAAWNRLVRLGKPFPLRRALPLLDRLILHGESADAVSVWNQALSASGWPQDADQRGSLVFNRGFEHDFAGGGLGWQVTAVPGASFSLDDSEAHSGRRSLRLSFDGTANLDLRTPQQFVAVQPGRRYELSAWLRTESISTDSGIRLEIADRDTGKRGLTPDLTGTHPWTRLATSLCSGPETQILLISVRRVPSEKFDNKLSGSAWVDDVSLAAEGSCPSPEATP